MQLQPHGSNGQGNTAKSSDERDPIDFTASAVRAPSTRKGLDVSKAAEVTIDLECVQLSALLMDQFKQDEMVAALHHGARKPPNKQAAVEEVAAGKIYRDAEGYPVMPYTCLFAMLRDAGTKVTVGGKTNKISTAERTNLPSILSSVVVDGVENPELIRLALPAGTNPHSMLPSTGGERENDAQSPWRMDVRQGRNENSGGTATCILRPRFDTWGFRFQLKIDMTGMSGLSLQHIFDLVTLAGKNMGFGAFRPSKGGPFGRFKITKFEVVDMIK